MRSILQKSAALAVIAVFALNASACREEEQGRLLSYEKGVYLGQSDTSLTETQLSELANRTRMQGGY
jgi:hypothetical protein